MGGIDIILKSIVQENTVVATGICDSRLLEQRDSPNPAAVLMPLSHGRQVPVPCAQVCFGRYGAVLH